MSIFLHQIFYANNKFDNAILSYEDKTPSSQAVSTFRETIIDELLSDLRKWAIITYEDNSSSVHLDSVLRSQPDIPATRVIPQTRSATLPGASFCFRETVPPKPRHILPKHLSMFQSIFVSVFGIEEYMRIGNRMPNRELEEKQKIMLELSKTPKKLKECNQRLTNDNIQEILSGLYVSTNDEIMLLVAYSVYYNRIIYLVFKHSYLVVSPTKDATLLPYEDKSSSYASLSNPQTPTFFSSLMPHHGVLAVDIQNVVILNQTRNHPKYGGSYMVDMEPTAEKIASIHNTKIHLEHYAKPFKGISAYKMADLECMYRKISDLETVTTKNDKKMSKKELYDIIVEICCVGISRFTP